MEMADFKEVSITVFKNFYRRRVSALFKLYFLVNEATQLNLEQLWSFTFFIINFVSLGIKRAVFIWLLGEEKIGYLKH